MSTAFADVTKCDTIKCNGTIEREEKIKVLTEQINEISKQNEREKLDELLLEREELINEGMAESYQYQLLDFGAVDNVVDEYNNLTVEECLIIEIPKVAERYKGICGDWWDPANAFETEDFDDYPSSKICECFAEKFLKTMTTENKKNLAMINCKYGGSWFKFEESAEYKQFIEFATGIWNICDKEVPRFNNDE